MDSQNSEQSSMVYIYLVSFVAAIGGFLFGYDLDIMAPAQLYLRSEFALNDAQWGFAVSSAVLGCIAGPFLGAWLCDWLGRKSTLIVAAILFGVSAIGSALCKDITTFYIYRIIGGVGVGLASVASPIYIAEMAPAKFRGRLGLLYQLAIVIGSLGGVVVAYFLAKHLAEHLSWRWMFASEMIPVMLFGLFLFFVPRSPRWLAKVNRNEEAMAVLTRINGIDQATLELKEINESISKEKDTGTFSELLKPGIRMALLVGILLAIFGNLTGFTAIGYYMPTLFQMAGFEEKSGAILQMLILCIVVVFLTLLAIWLVDRVGRRKLWNITSIAMIFGLTLAGVAFHFKITGPFILVVIFMCAWPHCIGLGPLPWLMMSEIQPTRIRAKAVSITTTFTWIAMFACAQFFPFFVKFSEKIFGSIIGIFLMYAGVCILSLLFGWKMLPETKNKSLEEIADLWLKNK